MANPTMQTQDKIISVIRKSETPISITTISKLSKTGFYETKLTIDFLHKLGLVDLVISSGNITLVKIKRGFEKNATNLSF